MTMHYFAVRHRHHTRLIVILAGALLLTGCEGDYNPGSRAVGGGLLGGGTGAAIGALAGGGRGAAIGALAGGVLGAGAGALTTPNRGGYQQGSYYNSGNYVPAYQPGNYQQAPYPPPAYPQRGYHQPQYIPPQYPQSYPAPGPNGY